MQTSTAAYFPSEDQIRLACTRIRAKWDPAVRDFRHRVSDARQKTLAKRVFVPQTGRDGRSAS